MIALSPKLLVVTMIGITLIGVSVTIVINRPPERQVPPVMRHVPDTDGDGVPDDQDLLIRGDAGIRVQVESFQAKNSCGNLLPLFNPRCQPKFMLSIDTNLDGFWDETYEKAFKDTNTVSSVFDEVVDVPDSATRVRVYLTIVDQDGGDSIDFWSAHYPQLGSIDISLCQGSQSLDMEGHSSVSASLSLIVDVVSYMPFP